MTTFPKSKMTIMTMTILTMLPDLVPKTLFKATRLGWLFHFHVFFFGVSLKETGCSLKTFGGQYTSSYLCTIKHKLVVFSC